MHRNSRRDLDYERYRDTSRERSRERRSRSRDRSYRSRRDRSPYRPNHKRERDSSRTRRTDYRGTGRTERFDSSRERRDNGRRYERRSRSKERPARSTSKPPNSLAHFGNWYQHVSSNGKIYYFDSSRGQSQWEKPREWVAWEKRQEEKADTKTVTPPPDVKDASPLSEDSPISSSEDEDGGQTPETRQEVLPEAGPLQTPQFLPETIPSREQILESSPVSERSPSTTSSQADQTPPRDEDVMSPSALIPAGKPMTLSPSLSAYYNEVLITHMTAWRADQIERQADRVQHELFTIASVHSSSISAELKMARSMVRLAEIQATLQEQRALFLHQQITHLEEQLTQATTNGN